MMISPSSALPNRSFLYGNAAGGGGVTNNNPTAASLSSSSSSSTSSSPSTTPSSVDKIVYARLHSAALSRASLPLRLLPCDINADDNDDDEEEEEKAEEEENSSVKQKPTPPTTPSTTRSSPKLNGISRQSPPPPPPPAHSKPTSFELEAITVDITTLQDGTSHVYDSDTIVITTTIHNNNNNNNHHHIHNNNNKSHSQSSLYKKKPSKKSKSHTKKDDVTNDATATTASDKNNKKERREFTFAKNVLHYVPLTSRRYYRKSRKLASKSLSLKSLSSSSRLDDNDGNFRTLNSRSLSRDELKYITISTPSNFVHVASATKRIQQDDSRGNEEVNRPHIRHEGRYADLRHKVYAEILLQQSRDMGKDGGGDDSDCMVVNDSFLWGRLVKRDDVIGEDEEKKPEDDGEYDDVGPPVNTPEKPPEPANHSHYDDDDGTPDPDPDAYDDVGPAPPTTSPPPPPVADSKNSVCQPVDNSYDDDEQVYDDVGPLRYEPVPALPPPEKKPQRPTSLNVRPDFDAQQLLLLRKKKIVEVEEEIDEDVYDDVGLPLRSNSQECHERVNSLYAGSSASGSIQLAINGMGPNDKESEWEDLEETALYGSDGTKHNSGEYSHSASASPSKKKLQGQRWSRKVRRQRSKASRKSSGRSTSRTRATRLPTTTTSSSTTTTTTIASPVTEPSVSPTAAPTYSVAVSLGAGTVLLLGRTAIEDEKLKDSHDAWRSVETKGLVQLRVLVVEADEDGMDVQETSLYVAEDSSDDSNYETLETYEPDDFSSESEAETAGPVLTPSAAAALPHLSLQEAPSRPIPLPPREASLGHTLGRRIKMLRRTWSITKGSLGRMRRRASGGEGDSPSQENNNTGGNGGGDARKYFSFKKHFRKSQASSTNLSTFYLDKSVSGSTSSEEKVNGAGREEPIYQNSNWYREVGLYREEERRDSRAEEALIDHYSVLTEEPLYQFYAAAATRVAFESDSDGYEEVEELTPSAATTDLARPGHRTLWCQTPQVINSGLLQTLTMEERKIQEAKFEILTSEASYLNSLRVLENEFASNYELVHEILTPAERERLFGSVPDVLVASERFLAELEGVWREDPMLARLPELMLKHGEKSEKVYVNYCSNQVSIDVMLKELKSKKGYKFLETVSRIEMHPACQSLSLHSFLMLPMQRITRLPLLADAVLSKLSVEHPDRLSWEGVLAGLSQIVARCNEGARLAERRNEMEALARKLEYSAKVPPVVLRDRELIRSGTVVQLSTKSDTEYKLTFGKKFHKTPLMLMLLTDYLLVTKLKSNSNEDTYHVIEACKRNFITLESVPEDSPFAGRHAMVLTLLENHVGRPVEYIITCENDTEKERWLDAVSPPKPTCVGETLYESWDCPQVMAMYSYAPRQRDELALQPGDVINVLRKMNDGWLYGEKLLDGEQGWFPGNFTNEVASEHVRARNLRQRHRFLALTGSVLQRKAKQSLSLL